MNLSPHFTLAEMTRSQQATRMGLDNIPTPEAYAALRYLCRGLMEGVRALVGAPLRVSSGYRSPAVNRAVGGSPSSQHQAGEACDFEVDGVSNLDVAKRIVASDLQFDQLILEFYSPLDLHAGWVHISDVSGRVRRRQVLTATRRASDGKVVYSPGLPTLP
jgi:zinc D-Ala-D-Ala carboxypeptidase